MRATMGPTPDDVAALQNSGQSYSDWILNQASVNVAQTSLLEHVRRNGHPNTGYKIDPNSDGNVHPEHVFDAWWYAAIKGQDQLRQRVAFALSQIYVISMAAGAGHPYAAAHYYDSLAANAFGGWVSLLTSVCTHPAMGNMLSHIGNWPLKQPRHAANVLWGKRPDQNFARELLQLFTIGLHELHLDGTPVRVNGQLVETYTSKDIEIISSIFTGWGWDRTNSLMPERGYDHNEVIWKDELPQTRPMKAFPEIHEEFTHPAFRQVVGEDRIVSSDATSVTVLLFKGRDTTNGGFSTELRLENRQPEQNLQRLLLLLLKHPNTAPFLAKQMIQRLVTSNPSPKYVEDVARTFKSRPSMLTLVRSVLLDQEAMDPPAASGEASSYYGKVREPVLRMTHILRALKAVSYSGRFMFTDTSNPAHAQPAARLGQAPLYAPSVFNFYRPQHRHPQTVSTSPTLVAPEMQIFTENAAAGYIRTVEHTLEYGFGRVVWSTTGREGNLSVRLPRILSPDPQRISRRDREDIEVDLRDEYNIALGDMQMSTTRLVDAVDAKFFGGFMPSALKTTIQNALRSSTTSTMDVRVLAAARVRMAIFCATISPEFIVQQ